MGSKRYPEEFKIEAVKQVGFFMFDSVRLLPIKNTIFSILY
jgi:hypothetical protein